MMKVFETGLRLLVSCFLLLQIYACSAETALPECERTADMPVEFKMDNYRSETPSCLPNGNTLNVQSLRDLIAEESPVLIDVWAIYLRVDEDFGSMWVLEEEHYSLPEAVWLPNIGYGEIKPEFEQYLKSNLEKLTLGNKNKPLVFFCVSDCWMSWNAAQRVQNYGYTQVYWYRDGTDVWEDAGFELIEVHPVEFEEGL